MRKIAELTEYFKQNTLVERGVIGSQTGTSSGNRLQLDSTESACTPSGTRLVFPYQSHRARQYHRKHPYF